MRAKILIGIFIMSIITLLFTPSLYHEEHQGFEFSDLNISEGVATFSPRWKGQGGDLIVSGDGFSITLVCHPYGHNQGPPCYKKYSNNSWHDLEKVIQGRRVVVWWKPGEGARDGRLYQLAIDGEILINFDEIKNYYIKFGNN